MLKYLLQSHCLMCKYPTELDYSLCASCQQALPWRRADYCQRCGITLESKASLCGQCLKKPPYFDQLLAAFDYQGLISTLIQQFKFQQNLAAGNTLSHLLAQYLQQQAIQLPQAILAVPMHHYRLWSRGFNQAQLIVDGLSQLLACPHTKKLCRRTRHTQAQVSLGARERRQNLKAAFHVRKNAYQHIALVDDVTTTGATINNISKALKHSGIKRVDIWCLAKAPSSSYTFSMPLL